MTQQELLERMKLLSTAIQINGEVQQVVMGDATMNIYNGCNADTKNECKSQTENKQDDSDLGDYPDDIKLRSYHDAIETLRKEGWLKRQSYFAIIMAASEQMPLNYQFDSTPSFLRMLREAQVSDLPDPKTVNNALNNFVDRYEDIDKWSFRDADVSETTYRKNVAKRFRAIYTKRLREDGLAN